MNLEKLKDKCRFCANYTDDEYCKIVDPCRHQYVVNRPDLPDRWELHPDIAEAIQPETTELIAISFKSERYHEPVLAYFETACCKVSPIYNENFCPNCGRRIKNEALI